MFPGQTGHSDSRSVVMVDGGASAVTVRITGRLFTVATERRISILMAISTLAADEIVLKPGQASTIDRKIEPEMWSARRFPAIDSLAPRTMCKTMCWLIVLETSTNEATVETGVSATTVDGRNHRIWTDRRHHGRAHGHRRCLRPDPRKASIHARVLRLDRNSNEISMPDNRVPSVRSPSIARAGNEGASG